MQHLADGILPVADLVADIEGEWLNVKGLQRQLRFALVDVGERGAGIQPQLRLHPQSHIGTGGGLKIGLPNELVFKIEPWTAVFAL